MSPLHKPLFVSILRMNGGHVSSIRKTVLLAGKEHYINVESSLDLEGVDITGSDPDSGKVIHISLSALMKEPKEQIKHEHLFSQDIDEPMKSLDMFSIDESDSPINPQEQIPTVQAKKQDEKSDSNLINDLFE